MLYRIIRAGTRLTVFSPLLAAACTSKSDESGSGGAASAGTEMAAGKASTSGGSDDAGGRASGGSAGRISANAGRAGAEGGRRANGGEGGRTSAGSGGRANGGEGGRTSAGSGGRASAGSGGSGTTGKSGAAELARKLGREPNFLIGMGNDLPGDYNWEKAPIFSLPKTLDIHYYYLTNGWQDWNPGGWFPIILGDVDVKKGVIPMTTLYGMTGLGENNLSTLTNQEYMNAYWVNLKLLFTQYATELDDPGTAIVHLEPDFWGFAQQSTGGKPASQPAVLSPECDDLPNDLTGMGRCIVKLARRHAPKVALGFHASGWAGDGEAVGKFLADIGGSDADMVVIDMLDRDAGCFEAGVLPQCQRDGAFYWDETNQKSPNFREHLTWARAVSETVGVPILWWQLPFGVPSETPGGTPGHYRDNRVKYLFEHVQEFVDAGGMGACFGTGAGDQTFINTDGGQFEKAVVRYFENPVPLP
jgi:hypothetical protein